MELSAKLKIEDILDSANVAELLDEKDQKAIGRAVCETFDMDRMSRAQWEQRMEKAAKIALQVVEQKTFPWPGASNVKFPLLTIAALQYHSRVYPALIDLPNVVQCALTNGDPKHSLYESARRVEAHMNWQLMEEDEQWEGEMDKTFFVQALMGTAIKKTYFDSSLGHNVSELVMPQDFVVSYYTKNLETCPRATHVLTWDKNTIVEKTRRGQICDTEVTSPKTVLAPFGQLAELKDKVQGLSVTTDDPEQPYTILEQHRDLDLDGDGYAEPYVVQVRYDTRQLLRILPNYLPSGIEWSQYDEDGEGSGEILRITKEQFFTKYELIPSPDGGFYALGFGSLLGPLNESIDTAINQLFDAGTMHNAGGGFLGRGAKFKSGDLSFRPNEWKRVDTTGDDLRKSIVELPRREPSAVLFNLLSLLIDFGQRVAGATDAVQGMNPGQNTPAETQRSMVEQGMKIFGGIYKRTFRSLRSEIRKLYRLNSLYLEESKTFSEPINGFEMKVLYQDYQIPSTMIRPAAASEYVSDTQRLNQATALLQASTMTPGYDRYRVNLYYLTALRVPNPDAFFPDPKGPNAIPMPPNPKLQVEQLKAEVKMKEAEMAQREAEMEMRLKLFELMEAHDLNRAKIMQLEAQAVALLAQAGEKENNAQISLMNAQIAAAKLEQEGRTKGIELLRGLIDTFINKQKVDNETRRLSSVETPPRNSGNPGQSSGQTGSNP